MSWSSKRQFTIITTIVLAVVIPSIYFGFIFLYKPATCFDGKENGREEGVDCGGTCSLICKRQAFEPVILWQRAFKTDSDKYNLIAYVENANLNAFAKDTKYTFKLYDNDNILIKEVKGHISIPPRSVLPITEISVTSSKEVSRVGFGFDNVLWQKESGYDPLIVISNEKITNQDIAPRISATLQNIIFKDIRDIKVVVIVYDSEDNAIGVSSTLVNGIAKDSSTEVVFTWAKPFDKDPARFEIVPLYEVPN